MLSPASGIGNAAPTAAKVIRFVRQGCANRPFFHIVVSDKKCEQYDPVVEQVGSYDPIPNDKNEKLVSLNFERIRYWIGNGATISLPVQQLLGLSGFLPIHPTSYMTAWRNRRTAEAEAAKAAEEAAAKAKEQQSPSEEKS